MKIKSKNAVSLFSSSGIGELGIRENHVKTVIANELIPERASLYKRNFPEAKMFFGDIWKLKTDIVDYYNREYNEPPFLINATPPCQGMSLAGMGKMLSEYRSGKQPKLNPEFDERNRLVIPAVEIIRSLKPNWVLMENVENMKNTLIYDNNGKLLSILDYIFSELRKSGYAGRAEVIDTADYGVPQNRKRLIIILTREKNGKKYLVKHNTFLPARTHSKHGDLFTKPWVTVREAIGSLPPLDAVKGHEKRTDFNKLHVVPVLDHKKYNWISYTPEGHSAFDNQCVNPECMFQGNPTHGSKKNSLTGVTQSLKNTPLFCERCGEMLPRPYVKKDNVYRIMKGYISAYKRMWWDRPASTLTTRFQFVSSDNNVHPSQNRVLSLYEGTVLQTISKYSYNWFDENGKYSLGLVRDSIGESIPPLITDLITHKILSITSGDAV